ncbi:hypothetical protein GCM10023093_24850 [Nemorincola caseinilytica]|uniref:Fibronectin type-III domain-containing protein n=1 Tax=Nemorincola caseinilytica TaxID=2054315 RepID=A0ABP8NLU9_9BACT
MNLMAQSPDGKTVKLVWFFNSVQMDMSGFDIKRKDGLGDWKKLNSAPLMPGISLKKDLIPAGPDGIEIARVKEKLKDLLKNGSVQEYSYPAFMARWKAGDKAIQDIFMLAELDFDVSLMSGFGFVDRTVTQRIDYQYGLFVHGTNVQLAQVSWNYGEIPDLNVVQDITSRVDPGTSRGVHLVWNADMDKVKAGYVTGFNIYKRGIRLNDRPIAVAEGKGRASEFEWLDKTGSATTMDQYSISAQSLFGIEGIIRSYTFHPHEHPAEYKKPIVTNLTSLGYYFKDGMSIEWSFPPEYERFIKGFYVEKDNMPAGYMRTSALLNRATRSYIDRSGSQANYYIRVRVVAIYEDRSVINGVERLFNYFPSPEAPKPHNTVIKAVMDNNRRQMLHISWDPPINGDNTTHHYRLYQYDALNDKFVLQADDLPLRPAMYKLPVPQGNGGSYKFYVVAVNKAGTESMPGDVATWQPTTTDQVSQGR